MPVFIGAMAVLLVVYQMFFRYEHWVDATHNNIVYERDNLTGQMHTVSSGDKVSFFDRILGKSYIKGHQKEETPERRRYLKEHPPEPSPRDIAVRRMESVKIAPVTITHTPVQEPVVTLTPQKRRAVGPTSTLVKAKQQQRSETFTTLALAATNPPTPKRRIAPAPPPVKFAVGGPEILQPVAPPTAFPSKIDLNKDGQFERFITEKTASDGLIDISILSDQRELFYGRGKALQVLKTQKAGWSDIALITGEDKQLAFRYNPAHGGYEVIN